MGFNSAMQLEQSEYTKPFLAQVVANNDPDKRQRIKVRIPGLLDGTVEFLPWVLPKHDTRFGTGTGPNGPYGHQYIPPVGALVVVRFQEGDLTYGLTDGVIPSVGIDVLQTNYPNRYGLRDPGGNYLYVDTQSGDIEFKHKSGTTIHVRPDGTIDVIGQANVNANIHGTVHAIVQGNLSATVDGNTSVHTSGDTDLQTAGSMNLQSGGAMNLTAGGNLKLVGARIDLN
jgi:hypothetical protein